MIDFTYAWVYWLLPLPLLVRQVLPPFRDVRAAVRVPLFDVVVEAIDGSPSKGAVVRSRTPWQAIVYSIVWVCVITALAKPQWLEPPIVREVPTRDLLLAIDLSGSMETEDFTDSTGTKVDRLTAVKEVLDSFLRQREGDRVGMVVFGTGAFVQVPFTQDLNVCRELMKQTEVRMAGPRTAFGDAIGLAITLFQRSELEDKVVIALTDGNDTGSKVPPIEAATIAADEGIVIHTVGVGDPAAAGEEQFDEQALKSVSEKTGGRYFYAADRIQLQEIYDELDKLGQRKTETISHQPRRDYYFVPLAIGFSVSLLHLVIRWLTVARNGRNRELSSVTTDDYTEVAA